MSKAPTGLHQTFCNRVMDGLKRKGIHDGRVDCQPGCGFIGTMIVYDDLLTKRRAWTSVPDHLVTSLTQNTVDRVVHILYKELRNGG